MFSLREYKTIKDRTADLLPWAGLLGESTMLTKTGELAATIRYRGLDLESAGKAEQTGVAARLNNVLKRLVGGWAVQTEAWQKEVRTYPESTWVHPVAALLDAERKAAFEEEGSHFETNYYCTLIYRTPTENRNRLMQYIWENLPDEEMRYGHVRGYFEDAVKYIVGMFHDIFPYAELLREGDLLSYYHHTATLHEQQVEVPDVPMFLDVQLGTEDLAPGIRPMIGDQYIRALTLRSLPATTWPGLFSKLEELTFPYRWVQRWIVLDQAQAVRECRKYERRWLGKRKGLLTLLREEIFKTPSAMSDPDAEDKAADARAAQGLVASGQVAFGYYTGTLIVWDADAKRAAEKLDMGARVLEGRGVTLHREDLNTVEAWCGSIPGNVYANLRRPMVHSMNLSHLLPCNAVWAGEEWCEHLDGPPIMQVSSVNRTPFRLHLHQGDVGDTLIIGPKGSGKSTLLSMLALQWQRYPNAQTFLFDKGGSARAATQCMGGKWYSLGNEGGLALQPLAHIDQEDERIWAMEWLEILLVHEKVAVTPERKTELFSAVTSLANSQQRHRTLTSLTGLVQDREVREALVGWTIAGTHGGILDADEDHLRSGGWQCFETGALLEKPSAVVPTLFALFHRLEQWLTGAPTLIPLDEAWIYLDHPVFASRLRLWLKTLRKLNASTIFASQNLADVSESSIAATVAQECQTRIFLPNARAMEPQIAKYYESFGLFPRQIEVIAMGTPKRHYYYQSSAGNRLFELELGDIGLALAGSGSTSDLLLLESITQTLPDNDDHLAFAKAWFEAKQLPWAAELLRQG